MRATGSRGVARRAAGRVTAVLGRRRLDRALARAHARRTQRFFEAEAERIARLCHRMAERFARGGRLLALGALAAARSDARHVAVEFVHPVIVGKRALPALGAGRRGRLARGPGRAAGRAGRHRDRASAPTRRPRRGGRRARARLPDAGLRAGAARSGSSSRRADDPFVAPGARRDALPRALGARARVLRAPRPARGARGARVHDTGASSFLYPFLAEPRERPRGGGGGRARARS